MTKRIVVNVKPGALGVLPDLAVRLADRGDMRIGASFPRQGLIVGEVQGQMEVDLIAGMPEVAGVRVQASTAPRKAGRAGRAAARSA